MSIIYSTRCGDLMGTCFRAHSMGRRPYSDYEGPREIWWHSIFTPEIGSLYGEESNLFEAAALVPDDKFSDGSGANYHVQPFLPPPAILFCGPSSVVRDSCGITST